MWFRSVSAEGLGSDAERLTALLLDRQAELHSILQQVFITLRWKCDLLFLSEQLLCVYTMHALFT